MPDFETVVEHAQDYIEGKTKTPKVINDLEDVTCRFQSCCMVSWNSKSWWKWQKVWQKNRFNCFQAFSMTKEGFVNCTTSFKKTSDNQLINDCDLLKENETNKDK